MQLAALFLSGLVVVGVIIAIVLMIQNHYNDDYSWRRSKIDGPACQLGTPSDSQDGVQLSSETDCLEHCDTTLGSKLWGYSIGQKDCRCLESRPSCLKRQDGMQTCSNTRYDAIPSCVTCVNMQEPNVQARSVPVHKKDECARTCAEKTENWGFVFNEGTDPPCYCVPSTPTCTNSCVAPCDDQELCTYAESYAPGLRSPCPP